MTKTAAELVRELEGLCHRIASQHDCRQYETNAEFSMVDELINDVLEIRRQIEPILKREAEKDQRIKELSAWQDEAVRACAKRECSKRDRWYATERKEADERISALEAQLRKVLKVPNSRKEWEVTAAEAREVLDAV